MMCVGIAILLMVAATVGVHMGLPQAIASVLMKISKCHKCMSFWLTLLGLLLIGCPLIYAVLLSLLSAYMSDWFAMLLVILNKISERLWQRLS